MHLEVEVVAVGVPEGLRAQVQMGGAQQGFFGRGQGIESGKKEAVDALPCAPSGPCGFARSGTRRRGSAKLHARCSEAVSTQGFVVAGVEFGELAPKR